MRVGLMPGLLASVSLMLSSCGGGSSGGGTSTSSPTPAPAPTAGQLYAVPGAEALSGADVQSVVARAAAEATARHLPAVIAVVDRVGNVLAMFRMTGARATAITSAAPNGVNIDAQNLTIPAEAGAIAKAVTGAYLSSGGNAFSTRTASQIVQPNFPPAPSTMGLESGPLFGVQFSQLPCSDLSARYLSGGAAALIGPKRSPLGLAADPGGFPLYKNGVVVGGVGVMADGVYGFDPNTLDIDNDPEEAIALAGTIGRNPAPLFGCELWRTAEQRHPELCRDRPGARQPGRGARLLRHAGARHPRRDGLWQRAVGHQAVDRR